MILALSIYGHVPKTTQSRLHCTHFGVQHTWGRYAVFHCLPVSLLFQQATDSLGQQIPELLGEFLIQDSVIRKVQVNV